MTNQEAYDIIRPHLLSMKERCVDHEQSQRPCLYNGPNGTHCGLGILLEGIPIPKRENQQPIADLLKYTTSGYKRVAKRLKGIDFGFLRQCQQVHDLESNWTVNGLNHRGKESLRDLAKRWELKIND